MKILITGICGFVGSTLTPVLREAGHQAIARDLANPVSATA